MPCVVSHAKSGTIFPNLNAPSELLSGYKLIYVSVPLFKSSIVENDMTLLELIELLLLHMQTEAPVRGQQLDFILSLLLPQQLPTMLLVVPLQQVEEAAAAATE